MIRIIQALLILLRYYRHTVLIRLNHPLTHSFTHSFTYSLTYSFTHSLTHSLIHSLIHSLTHSFTSTTAGDDIRALPERVTAPLVEVESVKVGINPNYGFHTPNNNLSPSIKQNIPILRTHPFHSTTRY